MNKMRLAVAVSAAVLLAACGGEAEQARQADVGEAGATAPAAAADARPAAFALCASCHSVEPGRHGVGPSLHGVFGRPAGSLPGYNYSPAMKAFAKVWDQAELDGYLTRPTAHVPGTKMIFPGIPNAERRQAVIDYLATLK